MTKRLVITSINKVRKNDYLLSSFSWNYKKGFPKKNRILIKQKFSKKQIVKDREYIIKVNEKILNILKNFLNEKHGLNCNKNYWRIILYPWINHYVYYNLDKWQIIKKLKKNFKEKYTVEEPKIFSEKIFSKNHRDFEIKMQDNLYNFLILKRIINFQNLKNICFLNGKKNKNSKMLNDTNNDTNKVQVGCFADSTMQGSDVDFTTTLYSKKKKIIILLKKLVSSLSFNYNKFLFDEFDYPSKHFLKLCFRLKQIPAKNLSFFGSSFFGNNSIDLANYDLNERKKIFSYFKKYRTKDQFYNYLLNYIFIDLPIIYFEHFETMRKKIINKSLIKKIIVSQYAIYHIDKFRFYVAEAKKNGSKLILVDHGGGAMFKYNLMLNYLKPVSDIWIKWNKDREISNFGCKIKNLSPTNSVISFKPKENHNNFCTIVTNELHKFNFKPSCTVRLNESIDEFKDLLFFSGLLKKKIKNKLKFRVKYNKSFFSDVKFAKKFGKKSLDPISEKNDFFNTLSNSKLLIFTYAQTAFLQALFLNKPSILLWWKNHNLTTKIFTKHIEKFKKEKMAFEDMKMASRFINKKWDKIDHWWYSDKVQSIRKDFLKEYFDVNKNWHDEWVNYLNSIKM